MAGWNRRLTMTNTKTLMLAAFTAITLTAGAALAQEQGGPSFAPSIDLQSPAQQTWPWSTNRSAAQTNRQVQAGSADIDSGMRAYDLYNPYTGN
jgi:hypothetical protein